MNYELLAEQLIEKYEGDELINEQVAQLLSLAVLILGPILGVRYVSQNEIPEWITDMAQGNIFYRIASVIDPTGLMSWPYYQIALENWKANPDDFKTNAMLILSIFSMVPGVGFGARGIVKLITWPVRLPFSVISALSRLFRMTGRAVSRSSRAMDDVIPTMLAKMSGKTHNGVDAAIATRSALEKSMGIKISDEAIEAAAKKNNIKLAEGLIKTTARLKTATAILKPFTRGTRTVTAATTPMKPGGGGNGGFKSIPRTPVIRGPRQSYGHIGGVVKPL